MHVNAYQDWSRYYSNILIVFLGKQLLKIVGGLMLIIVRADPHTSSENFIDGEVVYYPNSNNLTRTLILLHNNANLLKELIRANYLIPLTKPLIIYPTSMLHKCFKYTCVLLTFSFVCGNMGSETGNNTGHNISGHAS